jgi:hypothetical protein
MANSTKSGAVAKQASNEPIRLIFGKKDRKVFVEAENHDRFMMSINEAARACQRATQTGAYKEQCQELLRRLARWLLGRQDKVETAFVSIQEADLLFVVVQKTATYDEDLEEALTDLDIEVANSSEFDLLRLDVQALPSVSEQGCRAFVGEDHLRWVLNRAE